jgi:hypothetical protein
LQVQVKRARDEAERTASLKLNDQERKEIELSIKLSQMQEELRMLKDQKS